jgi:heme-degrading monooxygenase HmoA
MFTLPEPEDIPGTVRILAAMEGRIPQIRYLEVGVDDSPTLRSAHVLLVTRFDSREAMQVYQEHPHHRRVIEHLQEVEAVAVKVDYAEPVVAVVPLLPAD